MLEFISLLRQRYQCVLAQLPAAHPQAAHYAKRIEQLTFAQNYCQKGQLLQAAAKLPLQIAVIGPTQAGKSSLVNALLEAELAGVSPLAGYTVHPQGFCVGVKSEECSAVQTYFGRYQQLPLAQLTKTRYDCYALTQNTVVSSFLPACVLWDTPDFDSIDAEDYREGVIKTLALADVIILIVSQEKYADQSVWDMMSALEPFAQPTLLCVNKLSADSENLILHSLKEKWQQARRDNFPAVISLRYQKNSSGLQLPQITAKRLSAIAKKMSYRQHLAQQQAFVNHYWQEWLEPIIAEHRTFTVWQQILDVATAQALAAYQRDYLHHPHYYATFQLALVELLQLLEIPALAHILNKMHRALSWPLRKLMSLGSPQKTAGNPELILLSQISEHFYLQILEKILETSETDKLHHRWWQAIYRSLRQQRPTILQNFNLNAERYHLEFQQEISASARRLYQKLEQQPAILNSLRATRLSADAAVIVFTVQTGGIGWQDLLITPAMLALTSLLTESAIGGFMKTQEAQLKQQQLATVKELLFINGLQKLLAEIPQQLVEQHGFGISPTQLQQAEQQRTEKRYGLRLF